MDLKKGRELEALQYKQALQALDSQEQARIARLNAEMVSRGLQRSDARLKAFFDERLNKVGQAINRRIEIRKDLVRRCPELGTPSELKRLMDPILDDLAQLKEQAQSEGVLIAPEVFESLRERGQAAIDAIKRTPVLTTTRSAASASGSNRVAAPAPAAGRSAVAAPASSKRSTLIAVNFQETVKAPASPRSTPPSSGATRGSATASGNMKVAPAVPGSARGSAASTLPAGPQGSAAVNSAYSKAAEAIKDTAVHNTKLADALHQLATAIKAATAAGEERAVYLEQIQFIAEQVARPATIRRVSVIQGLLVALRAGLQNTTGVAGTLSAAGPVTASHFGLRWPPR